MYWRNRVIVGLLWSTTGCARIVDADREYGLTGGNSSSQTTSGSGTAGGMSTGGAGGGSPCTTNDDCPPTGLICIANECTDGFCRRQNAPPGTLCLPDQSNVCDGQGECVQCTLAQHCVDIVEDQCTKRACIANTCLTQYLSQESPASPAVQQPGDCKIIVCDGFGGTKTLKDDTDTPNDDNGCTTDTCLNGSEVHTKVATGTACGNNSFCNSSGQCVGCLKPSDCSGVYDFCKERTCQSGICGIKYAMNGTALPTSDQVAQDCFVIVCDGAGNKVTRIDQNDGPADGDPCTRDSCTADGTPTYPPESAGAACSDGDNDACDGFGVCKKSQGKLCTLDDECVSTHCIDGVCCESTCDSTCSTCNLSPLTAGTCSLLPVGQTDANASIPCTSTSSCDGNGVCKKNNGQTCESMGDCLNGNCVDGYCCENACTTTCKACNVAGVYGLCRNTPRGITDNEATTTCNGTKACDGSGVCKLANGQMCTSNGQCASGNCSNGGTKVCQ